MRYSGRPLAACNFVPRYSRYGELDSPPLDPRAGSDSTFVGVNMRLSPNDLPPSIVALAVNKRFIKGEAQTRSGILELAPQNVGATVLGAAIFSDPNGYESIIVATASACYSIRDGGLPSTITLPSGTTLSGVVSMVQAFDQVLLFWGETNSVLQWDGTPGGAFEVVPQSGSGTGTLPIPGSVFAATFANRLFVPYTQGQRMDSILVSDILDYTRYVPQINQFRINFGTSDDIIGITPFGLTTLVIFKTASISYLRNVSGDLSSVVAAQLTKEVGLVATKAVAQIGSYLWFLGNNGVYRMTVTLGDDKIVLDPIPVSYIMQPFFNGVNWRSISSATMAVDQERLYICLPWGGSTVTKNNAVAVYNHITAQWEGYDTFAPDINCNSLLPLAYLGKRETWWVDASGRIGIFNKGLGEDFWAATNYAISDQLTTRAYYSIGTDRRAFSRIGVQLATFNPSFSVSTLTDDTDDTISVVASEVPSRTAYSMFGVAAYVLTNAGNDHDNAYRGDYRVLPSDSFQPRSGAQVELPSRILFRGLARSHGQYLQIDVQNTLGYCSVVSASVDAADADRETHQFN